MYIIPRDKKIKQKIPKIKPTNVILFGENLYFINMLAILVKVGLKNKLIFLSNINF